ncbi:MAG: pseudouridine synthase [Blautia sp.]|nr:pseudouridine synthase [Blautia sp.]MDY4516557.1 pseudouridine synthase [Lachnospiraceae bacterium]
MAKNRMQQEFDKRDQRLEVRLNKYLSEAGVCSRREADRLIEAGRVQVNGQTASMGCKIRPKDKILVDGRPCSREEEMILLAVNKPVGVVCTTDKRWGDRTVEEMLDYPRRVFSIGRLDKDSEGLLLMTNNGDILNKIMRAGNYHEKEYLVKVDKPVTQEFVQKMAAGGIPVLDQKTRPCRVEKTGKYTFRIILTQGLNRQIRRMCEYCGCSVVSLKRVRIMNIFLGNLRPGACRKLTDGEIEELYDMLKDSKSSPAGHPRSSR